jgi:hypothetical protein
MDAERQGLDDPVYESIAQPTPGKEINDLADRVRSLERNLYEESCRQRHELFELLHAQQHPSRSDRFFLPVGSGRKVHFRVGQPSTTDLNPDEDGYVPSSASSPSCSCTGNPAVEPEKRSSA